MSNDLLYESFASPYFVVAERRFSLLKSKSCLRFRQNIHFIGFNHIWTRERATLCTKCWSYLNATVWVLYLSKIPNVKMKLFFVLSSFYAMGCDANASSWQILKLTLETEHRIVNGMWTFAGNAIHSQRRTYCYARPYATMLCDTCI